MIVFRRRFENGGPGVRDGGCQRRRAVGGRHVLADRVPLVAIHTALALFEVDGVGGKVPMHDGVTPPVEIDAFLAYGSGRENEWPERRVERSPYVGESGFISTMLRATEPQCIPAGKRYPPAFKIIDIGRLID